MSLFSLIQRISCVGLLAFTFSAMAAPSTNVTLVTPKASAQTQALYRNMAALTGEKLLFGHQNTTAYGVKWIGEANRSDVKDVTGSYPAVFGWDIGHLESGDATNIDGMTFTFVSDEIKAAYKRGAINTISWHMRDPITGESSWTKNPSVKQLIPGAKSHAKLIAALDTFVAFNETLQVKNAKGELEYVPIIFRPWHEHNGDWFWWGKGENLSNEKDYIALWQFTVEYLRDTKGLTNLIFAFSPDRSRMDLDKLPESYLYGYPGDDYIDIIGLDNYWDLGHSYNKLPLTETREHFITSAVAISEIAAKKNKIAALSEGGQEKLHQDKFWTEMVLESLLSNEKSKRISYFLVWRNANKKRENMDHFYASYKGHKSEADFLKFYNHPFTVFENDLPELYK